HTTYRKRRTHVTLGSPLSPHYCGPEYVCRKPINFIDLSAPQDLCDNLQETVLSPLDSVCY
ncbi:MAG TPA: hypothetical protein VM260_13540, partial [Pirellula sp.]|nr:hypothetical protein [Pirellula sp.]